MKKRVKISVVPVITIIIFLILFYPRNHGDFSVIKPSDNIIYENVKVNGVNLNVATSGPVSGRPVILLHGYPDAHFGWREQIVALADAGFRVIAPDQRGYNLSDKPKGVDSYMLNILVSDIITLADHYGFDTFNLGGHDFGGIVSWNIADSHSDRIDKMVIFNSPHPAVNTRFQEENNEQKKKSWYAYFFKLPTIPELFMRSNDWKFIDTTMEESYSKDEISEYKRSWAIPGVNKSTINWYRGLFKQKVDEIPNTIIDIPTLVVWGKEDPHIMWQMAEPSASMTRDGRVIYIDDATHWILRDAPEETSEILIDFFKVN